MQRTYPEIASESTMISEAPKDGIRKAWILASDEDTVYSLKNDIESRISFGVVSIFVKKETYKSTGRTAASLYLEYKIDSDAYQMVFSFVEGWLCGRKKK